MVDVSSVILVVFSVTVVVIILCHVNFSCKLVVLVQLTNTLFFTFSFNWQFLVEI